MSGRKRPAGDEREEKRRASTKGKEKSLTSSILEPLRDKGGSSCTSSFAGPWIGKKGHRPARHRGGLSKGGEKEGKRKTHHSFRVERKVWRPASNPLYFGGEQGGEVP